MPLGLLAVSALSCPPDPSYWVPEGQYVLPQSGLVSDGDKMWDAQTVNVFKVEPGSAASIMLSYKRLVSDSSLNLTGRPVFKVGRPLGGGLRQALPAPSWLRTPSNTTVSVRSGVDHVNVTVNFAISKDAPLGEYPLYLAVEKSDADGSQYANCVSGYSNFFLRVAINEKATVTTTETTTAISTLTSTSTTVYPTTLTSITAVASTERTTEPFYLAWAVGATAIIIILVIFIILRKSESRGFQRSR